MDMILNKDFHIFKVTRKVATGDAIIGYYYSDDKRKIEEYLLNWDIDFDTVEVIHVVDLFNDIHVGGRRKHRGITDTEIGRMFRKIIGEHDDK